jgi:hypothetical protein
MTSPQDDQDPPPVPPVQPDLDDCCGDGCNPCVFDLYDEANERYRIALRAWRQRHEAAPNPQQAPPRDP